jgi:superfamily II DNA/RNA helicase
MPSVYRWVHSGHPLPTGSPAIVNRESTAQGERGRGARAPLPSTSEQFIADAVQARLANQLADRFFEEFRYKAAPSEVMSWRKPRGLHVMAERSGPGRGNESLAVRDLARYGIPPELIDRWAPTAEYLTDIQMKAIEAGLLDSDRNLLVAAPTSSGKTFVGELIAATSALRDRRRAIFAVPFKALAEEHYLAMESRYSGLLQIVISDADWSEFDEDIRRGDFNIAIATYEKLAALTSQFPEILARASTLVIDEIQMLGDEHRGPGLERFLTRILLAEQPPRLIALSASLDDLAPLSHWLRASEVVSVYRPVPLIETVSEPGGSAQTLQGDRLVEVRRFPPAGEHEQQIVEIAAALVREGSQVLIFRSTVGPTRTTAEAIARVLPASGLSETSGLRLAELEDSENVGALAKLLASGVAFHNADLTHAERTLVELAFRTGEVRALVSTTTLAMGVNLPTDWVVIADTTRYAGGRLRDLPVAEYKNAVGRAGRLGQRDAGYSILIADSQTQVRQLLNGFVEAAPEPVESQVPRRPFEDLVFAVVCEGLAKDTSGIIDFVTSTLAYQTFYEPRGDGIPVIRDAVGSAVDQCVEVGLFVREGDELLPTPWARQFALAGLGAPTAVRLASTLVELAQGRATPSDLLFGVAASPEAGDRPWPPRKFGQVLDPRPMRLVDPGPHDANGVLASVLGQAVLRDDQKGALVRLACLLDWVAGVPARELSRRYAGAAPVRTEGLGKNAAWLLETMARTAEVTGAPEPALQAIRDLAASCRYGVPHRVTRLARFRAPTVTRETLVGLANNTAGVELFDPDDVLGAEIDDFKGLLTPAQLASLKGAIERDTAATLARRLAGHLGRAEQVLLEQQLVSELYSASGVALEQAVLDVLLHLGLPASRVLRQPHGEEDIRLVLDAGTVVISITASRDEGKPIAWAKAREVLGTGAGFNPLNFVCIGRPRFESLAIARANDIGRETGARKILLLSLPAFAELLLRCAEGRMSADGLAQLLAMRTGSVDVDGLAEDGTE